VARQARTIILTMHPSELRHGRQRDNTRCEIQKSAPSVPPLVVCIGFNSGPSFRSNYRLSRQPCRSQAPGEPGSAPVDPALALDELPQRLGDRLAGHRVDEDPGCLLCLDLCRCAESSGTSPPMTMKSGRAAGADDLNSDRMSDGSGAKLRLRQHGGGFLLPMHQALPVGKPHGNSDNLLKGIPVQRRPPFEAQHVRVGTIKRMN
jgi:hypothetical protein